MGARPPTPVPLFTPPGGSIGGPPSEKIPGFLEDTCLKSLYRRTYVIKYGKAVPYPEPLPPERLPDGVPAPPEQAVTGDRDPVTGLLLPGPNTSELARRAAQAKNEQRRVEKLLSLATIDEEHPYAPYQRMVRQWRDDHMAELASTVGGGLVGPGPASIIASAALMLGQSRWLADLALKETDSKALLGLVERSQRLADSSRQNLLAAHELVAKEAKARAAQAKAYPASQVNTLVEALKSAPDKSTEGPTLQSATLDISDFPEIEDFDE